MASSIENMEECNSEMAAGAAGGGVDKGKQQEPSWEYHLRKYLMLLATLVSTATYAAGLSPPGGVWQAGETAGVPVLHDAPRYLAFFYLNATAFAASLVVNLLLLVLSERRTAWLAALRLVMVLDLLGLMGAYAAGSCRDVPTTVYASALVVALAAYVGIHILIASYASSSTEEDECPDVSSFKEQRKVLMLLATFAVGISYAAGLSPPGGFRDDAADAEAGDPVLQARHSPRLIAFFYCNTTAFVASLLVIVLLLGRRLRRYYARVQLYSFILVALFGLLGAYAAGSSREADTTAYVVALVGAVPAYIFLVMVLMLLASDPLKNSRSWLRLKSISARASNWLQERGCHRQHGPSPARELSPATSLDGGDTDEVSTSSKTEGMEKVKSLVLLLATLAATVTYQAGLDPPGGVWLEDEDGHKAGGPILLTTDARRYKVFFYCNSTAFVASLVVILMVQNRGLIRRHTLEAAMVLDLFALIGAYAAGSCRDVSTSVYVMALAGAVLVYMMIHGETLFYRARYPRRILHAGRPRGRHGRRREEEAGQAAQAASAPRHPGRHRHLPGRPDATRRLLDGARRRQRQRRGVSDPPGPRGVPEEVPGLLLLQLDELRGVRGAHHHAREPEPVPAGDPVLRALRVYGGRALRPHGRLRRRECPPRAHVHLRLRARRRGRRLHRRAGARVL